MPANTLPLPLRRVPPPLIETRGDRTIVNPDTGRLIIVGETQNPRTVFMVVSICCLITLSLFLGYRVRTLKTNGFKKLNMTSVLVVLLFFLGISFVICTTIVLIGLGVSTHVRCYATMVICLVFYTGNKLIIYVFLLERARLVRSPFLPRQRDWLWVAGMTIILGGFGTIAIIGYLNPIVELSQGDGRCRIGLPTNVSFPLLSFDVGVNLLLTWLFFWLLKPVLDLHFGSWVAGVFGKRVSRFMQRTTEERANGNGSTHPRNPHPQIGLDKKIIKMLLWKSLIGSVLIMLPTVANMTQFQIMKGRELAWICFAACTLDITWGVLVINWLTTGSAEAESNLNDSAIAIREKVDCSMGSEPTAGLMSNLRKSATETTAALEVPPKVFTNRIDDGFIVSV